MPFEQSHCQGLPHSIPSSPPPCIARAPSPHTSTHLAPIPSAYHYHELVQQRAQHVVHVEGAIVRGGSGPFHSQARLVEVSRAPVIVGQGGGGGGVVGCVLRVFVCVGGRRAEHRRIRLRATSMLCWHVGEAEQQLPWQLLHTDTDTDTDTHTHTHTHTHTLTWCLPMPNPGCCTPPQSSPLGCHQGQKAAARRRPRLSGSSG
jgi:hypothetical protein